jgi:hypothetical protein
LLSHHQNAGQNHDIKTANISSENEAQFKYLATTVTNQNLIQNEIKGRWNSGNARYCSIQNLLSSHTLSTNIKIRIYKIILLPVVLYGSETWSLILWEKHRLRVFENRVLRIYGLKRDAVMGGKVKLSLCLNNQALHHEGIWGSGRTDPHFLDLSTSWR